MNCIRCGHLARTLGNKK